MNRDPDERAQSEGGRAPDEFDAIVAQWLQEGGVPVWPVDNRGPAGLFEPVAADPTGTEPTVADPIGARPAGTEPKHPDPAQADDTQGDDTQADDTQGGDRQGDDRRAGADRVEPDRAEPHRTGPHRTGPPWTGPQRTGSHRTDSERAEPERAESGRAEPGQAEPSPAERGGTDPGHPGPAEVGPVRGWIPPTLPDDEHFVPPEPPPLPRIGPPAMVGLVLLTLGLVLMTAPGWVGVPLVYGLPLGLLGMAAGLGWLVLRLWPDPPSAGRDDDEDDGAVV